MPLSRPVIGKPCDDRTEARRRQSPLGVVLDEVGRRVDHARDDAFPVGQLHVLEDVPFVLVTGIGALEGDCRGSGLQHGLDDLTQGNVVVARGFVVAPAEMQAHALGRDIFGRRVEHLKMHVDDLAKLRERQRSKLPIPARAQIWAVELQREA